MKIAILGTRGIPNNYGGFEQLAEFLSEYLAKNGHEVYVYNSHNHIYQEKTWRGVNIIHVYDPEYKLGTFGQFIYDFNAILDSRKQNFDIILQLGYTSSSVWGWMLPSKPIIISNMDGLEWKRSKYNKYVQKFLKYAEKWAVQTSDYLVSDSIGIQNYLKNTYQSDSTFIAYGAYLFNEPNENIIKEFNLAKGDYDMIMARFEPENNLETVLDGFSKSVTKRKIIVVGKQTNKFGNYLVEKFNNDNRIIFTGPIYNLEKVNNLRFYSNVYFHGHSVGGTNPSLLEAMASDALICAHNNEFNKSILEGNAYYFSNSSEVTQLLNTISKNELEISKLANNRKKIAENYTWEQINKGYEDLFFDCLKLKK